MINKSISISRDSAVCRKCQNYNNCDNKRMKSCGLLLYADNIEQPLSNPILEDMAIKHDYRNIEVAKNTNITINVEEVKKNLMDEVYKSIYCGFRSD